MSVTDWPAVIVVGDATSVVTGPVGTVTVMAVHGPQLLPSLDSVIVPDEAAEFLSAHARTYHVATEGNVYESVALVFALPASVETFTVPMSVAFDPAASVAR